MAIYRRRVATSIEAATEATQAVTASAPVDELFGDVLLCAIGAASMALEDLAVDVRSSSPSRAPHGAEWAAVHRDLDEWAQAMRDPAVAARSLRVLAWGIVGRWIAHEWPEQWAEAIDVAARGLGIENEHERQVADFGPLRDGDTPPRGEYLALLRLTIGASIAAGLERAVDDDVGEVVLLGWPEIPSRMGNYFADQLQRSGVSKRLNAAAAVRTPADP